MPDVSFDNLLIISVVAVVAPLIVGFLPRLRVPAVVLEIVAGIVLGPSLLGWVRVDLPVQIVALFGLAFLLFLAGLEIDLRRLRGRILRLSGLGYVVTLALGLAAGVGFGAVGWVQQPLLLAIALSATSLGLVVPVLKDAGKVDSEVGQTAIAAATVADFAAIVLLSLFFSASDGSTGARLVLLVAFVSVVAATWLTVAAAGRSRRLGDVLLRLQDTTAEIRIRLAVVLLVAFTVLAERFGFLPADDPRMLATIDAIADRLTDERGLVYRYRTEGGVDGLAGDEGTFLLCTFWLAQAFAEAGRVDRAREVFERAIGYVNDVGLLAEEVDPATGELLGNFPQAFSHIGLVNAAWAIAQAEQRTAAQTKAERS